ncbi:MAG: Gfo/Idh/MocA family oxidoreductase [Acidiferrobacterales bacterium]|nr:Gfo/Idh/MocA family oxidoreductase [Acidiferrobacterales bacterium]
MTSHINAADKLKVGVIGAGFMGELHASHYKANDAVELIGVADIVPDTARRVAERFDCAWYTDSAQLAELADAISIAVPSTAHYSVAEICLNRKVHVLIEKPLASSLEEAQSIVELTHRNGVTCMVGHQERFNSAIMEASNRVDQPKYVEAHRQGKFGGRGGDVDVINDLMIHDIDLVLAFVKAPVASVSALGTSVVTQHVDVANARIEFENGSVANVTASRVALERQRIFQVYTHHQYMELDLLNQTMTVRTTEDNNDGDADTVTVESKVEVTPNITLKTEVNHFVDIVRNGGTPYVTVEDGLSAMQVAEMVRIQVNQN